MDYRGQFIGSKSVILSHRWGNLTVESAQLSPAADGDLVVYFGETNDNPLIRIHSECVFAELLGSSLCDCAIQLDLALQRLHEEQGILFYLRFDGRGAGLAAKVRATSLETAGLDTHESRIQIGVHPDSRSFEAVAQHLANLGLSSVRLMTNNPDKMSALERFGIAVAREPLLVDASNEHVRRLYDTKAKKFGHLIPLGGNRTP